MTLQFVPVDVGTPQEAFAKRLAQLLAEKGVADVAALSTAIEIMIGVQAALDAGVLMAAGEAWDERKANDEEFWLTQHPRGERAKAIRAARREAVIRKYREGAIP